MGEPAFKLRGLIERHAIRVFSSNYALYGDMSRRVNQVLGRFSPEVETYSIDESFLDLGGLGHRDLWAHAQDLRATVRRWTAIPTCVGLGPTKTLAKLANAVAKKNPVFGGVCDLMQPDRDPSRPFQAMEGPAGAGMAGGGGRFWRANRGGFLQ